MSVQCRPVFHCVSGRVVCLYKFLQLSNGYVIDCMPRQCCIAWATGCVMCRWRISSDSCIRYSTLYSQERSQLQQGTKMLDLPDLLQRCLIMEVEVPLCMHHSTGSTGCWTLPVGCRSMQPGVHVAPPLMVPDICTKALAITEACSRFHALQSSLSWYCHKLPSAADVDT